MRSFFFVGFAVVSSLFTACGGTVIDSGGGGTGGATSTSSTGSVTNTTPVVCGGLDFCGCTQAEGCQVVYGDCICGCDYQCSGMQDCACACGGGPYFGCAPATCQGPFSFQGTDEVSFDAAGCPVVAP